jgi:hypothetical protein
MRHCSGTRRISRQCDLEFWICESPPEMINRFPDGVIQKRTITTYAAMQLRREISWLPFHPIGIMLPCSEQSIGIGRCDRKDVYQNDG